MQRYDRINTSRSSRWNQTREQRDARMRWWREAQLSVNRSYDKILEHAATSGVLPLLTNIVNESGGWTHPLHIHDEEFAVISRNGQPPAPHERGLKDVFNLAPHDVVKVAAYWTGNQNIGKYVFHCHNLEHEDMRMMGIFEVVP